MSIWGSVISGGTSLLGNLAGNFLGNKSQKSANESNMKIAQMNNDFNANEAQKQRDFTLDMYNTSNDYNTASAQRKRYEDAGLNPYTMMAGGDAGVATNNPGGAQASASGNPQMQAFRPDFSSVASSMASFAQARNLNAQTANTEIKNLHESDVIRSNINKTLSDTNYRNLDPAVQQFYRDAGLDLAKLDQSTLEQQNRNMQYSGDLMKAQQSNALLSGAAQATLNKYLDEQQSADLQLKSVMYTNMIMEGQLTPIRARAMLADTLYTQAKARGQGISNHVAQSTAADLIESTNATNQYDSSYFKAGKPNAAKMFGFDYYGKQYKNMKSKYDAGQSKRDYQTYNLRNTINYGTKLFNGIGNNIGRLK